MSEQVPVIVIERIYQQYLFKDFLNTYKHFFEYRKPTKHLHSRYTWDDLVYRDFMIRVLMSLEPCKEESDTIIIEELDEFNDVRFYSTGIYEIGYSINNQNYFKLRFQNNNVIGAYGVTFHKRALFIYITRSECQGYFIRKNNWLKIIEDPVHTEFS